MTAFTILGAVVVSFAVLEFASGRGSATPWLFAGLDYRTYIEAAGRWLGGASFYPARELAGPFELTATDVLYPPTSLILFVPFVFLPSILWWAIPTVIIAWAIWAHRPNPPALVLIAVAVATPWTWFHYVVGNPVIWAAAALALATHHGWVGPAVLLKPTLAPLALLGARSRGWWLTLGLGVLAALAFLPLWSDWLAVMGNVRGDRVHPLYGIADLSLMSIPLLAWLGATAPTGEPERRRSWPWKRLLSRAWSATSRAASPQPRHAAAVTERFPTTLRR